MDDVGVGNARHNCDMVLHALCFNSVFIERKNERKCNDKVTTDVYRA